MSDNKVYPVTIQHFLTRECRIIKTDFDDCMEEDNYWIIRNDIFKALDRLDEETNDITPSDRKKYKEFIELMSWQTDRRKIVGLLGKDSLGRDNVQEVECIRLSKVPVLLTQFKPPKESSSLPIWVAYMKYVEGLLAQNKVAHDLFNNARTKEEILRAFQGILFTLAQVAEKVKCKNGKDLKNILIKMNLIEMQDDDIKDYDAKYFNCTNRTIRVKATRLQELVDVVAQYKKDNNIEDFAPKKRKTKKKLKCKNNGKEFNTIAKAAEYGNTGSTSIRNYLKGLQAYA